jgi:mannose-6-phosphate isomerase
LHCGLQHSTLLFNVQRLTLNEKTAENGRRDFSAIEHWTLDVGRWTFAAIMSPVCLDSPLTFEPIFMERIWGGRRLETRFGKPLPPRVRIGESWEISDRPEGQSVVREGPFRGKTLHELWAEHRKEIFGDVPASARFPLLIKLLDAEQTLSLQVHPPEPVAVSLGGEPKTEFWYVAAAEPDAELFVGLNRAMSRAQFEEALRSGAVADYVHAIPVKAGDAMFLPAGRFHAVGAGNLLVEVQQNSDTTYRVFDWNRLDEKGAPRQLHIEKALQCIDFADCTPGLVRPEGELLVRNELFEIQKWSLTAAREAAPGGEFAIICCLTGTVECAGAEAGAGGFLLIPAGLSHRELKPLKPGTSILRVTIPM